MKSSFKIKHKITFGLLLTIFLVKPILYAQILGDSNEQNSVNSTNWHFSVFADRSFLETSESWYSTYSVESCFHLNGIQLGFQLPINQAQHFILLPEPMIFQLDEQEINFEDSTRFQARADEYEISAPFFVFNKVNYHGFYFYSALSLLCQKTWTETPNSVTVNQVIFINWEAEQKQNYSALAHFIAGYQWNALTLKAGLVNLKPASFGDSQFKYKFSPTVLPLLGASYETHCLQFNSLWDSKSLTLKFDHNLKYFRLGRLRQLTSSLIYRNGINSYHFQSIKFGFEFPVTNRLAAQIGYMNTWIPTTLRDKAKFRDWQNSLFLDNQDFRLGSRLPQKSLFFRLSFNWDRKQKSWPIQVEQLRLFETQFYAARAETYVQAPIGFIEISNKSENSVSISLGLKTSERTTGYQTSVFSIAPGASKQVELYLHIDKNKHVAFNSNDHLTITAIFEEQAKIIASEPITLWGKNVWNGNIRELEWFISADEEGVKQIAEELMKKSKSQADEADKNINIQKLLKLQRFLTQAGSGFSYASDAISGSGMDFVQYPQETCKRKKGDCEDLTVYLIALLRALGIQTAVVEIRPEQNLKIASLNSKNHKKQGHVFLLVDTNINAKEIEHLSLNELQAISRVNRSGRRTLWLPIEPTQLQFGFECAFQKGVELYYDEIIDKEGTENETIKVHDF